MSSEQAFKNIEIASKITRDTYPCKVDINALLSRIREEKKKKNKENIVFVSLISSVLVVTGIIASL